VRIEIGPRDVKNGQAVLVRRDLKTKESAALDSLAARVPALLEDIQATLMKQASAFLAENIRPAATYDEFKAILETTRGFIRAAWCGGEACEDRIKAETMATIRVLPLEDEDRPVEGACVCCGAPGQASALFARSY
jgi:prolyl-tRNA synthetase